MSLHKEYEEIKVNRFSRHTRGFIKIQDGCENFVVTKHPLCARRHQES